MMIWNVDVRVHVNLKSTETHSDTQAIRDATGPPARRPRRREEKNHPPRLSVACQQERKKERKSKFVSLFGPCNPCNRRIDSQAHRRRRTWALVRYVARCDGAMARWSDVAAVAGCWMMTRRHRSHRSHRSTCLSNCQAMSPLSSKHC